MQFKNGWMAIVAIAASAMIFAAPTLATDYTFTGGGAGGWDDPDNWEPNGVPGEDDCIYVPGNFVVQLDTDRTLGNIIIDGTFIIPAVVVLTIDGVADDCDRGIQEIEGNVVLQGSGSVLRFIDGNQIVQGGGAITGQHNDAKIEIESGLKLTNKMLIEGHMKIDRAGSSGTATFENYRTLSTPQGIVRANGQFGSNGSPKILEFTPNLVLDDTDNGSYDPSYEAGGPQCSACSTCSCGYARLSFRRSAASLEGDFVINNCADMLFFEDVTTSGSVTHTAGTVWVDSGNTFTFTGGSYDSSPANNTLGTCGGSCSCTGNEP
jgi:hypothetical protein